MNTALRIAPQVPSSRRVRFLAAASGLVATASIAVTLAVSGGGSETVSAPSAAPETAAPDPATLYQRGAQVAQPSATIDRNRSAERFHHRLNIR